jgi:hypothetical protein
VTYEQGLAYDRKELAQLIRAFKAMDDEATKAAADTGFELSKWVAGEVREAGYSRYINPAAVRRIVDGGSVSKTSKVGQISYGFARQRFSGGGTTRMLWPGFEFGSKKFKQFPTYSGRFGRGGRGWFIYPTLRRLQPELVRKWETKFDEILKPWRQP